MIGEYVDTADNHDGIRIEHADGAWIHHNIIHGGQGQVRQQLRDQGLQVGEPDRRGQLRLRQHAAAFDKDSGTNNTYRRNFLTGNDEDAFHGNNQGKYMKVSIYDNVIDGGVALGYLVDGTEVHDNLIRGDVLAGHWAGELWNTHLWNNIVIASGKEVTAYNESKNAFVNDGERRHLRYMDYNVYTAPPRYRFGGRRPSPSRRCRAKGFEQHSQMVKAATDIFEDQKSYRLLDRWKKAGRDGDAVGPDNIAQVMDVKRYGPAARPAE